MKQALQQLAITALLVISSFMNFAQAPPLGVAGDFVLFTRAGGVSNNASNSIYTGDIGSNDGATTMDVNVNGVVQNANTKTATAAANLLIAYNQLMTTPTTVTRPLGELGNGETLTKGVYGIAATATLDGALTLDAQNDSNAVFIFKMDAAFSANEGSNVLLTNGTQACNVFWVAQDLITIGANVVMKGNLIVNDDDIVLNSGVFLEGRAFSTTGSINSYGIAAALPLGCGRLPLSGPVAPVLGTAACYALFSGSGFVNGDMASVITGDIGTNGGLTSGFDAAKVTGVVHAEPDNSTIAASLGVSVANTYIANLPNDIPLIYPAKFGNGLVLTPHTYVMVGATVLDGIVTLDAQNNPDAVFVIKVNGGAFSSTTNAEVRLINGAKSSNVFWRVEGSVILGLNTAFKGTVVCNAGEIILIAGSIEIDGRMLTVAGAMSTVDVNAVIPASTCAVLPLSWLYFNGKPVDNKVVLQWGTAREVNNKLFTIERSSNSRSFETLGTVMVDQKAVNPVYEYSFTDQKPLSVGYYRLSQTDIDGTKDYYKTIQVKLNEHAGFRAINYIRGNSIYVQASGASPANGTIELYNMEGRKMSSQRIMLTKDESTYKLDKPLSKGLYLVIINSNGVNFYKGKVMVQ